MTVRGVSRLPGGEGLPLLWATPDLMIQSVLCRRRKRKTNFGDSQWATLVLTIQSALYCGSTRKTNCGDSQWALCTNTGKRKLVGWITVSNASLAISPNTLISAQPVSVLNP